MVVQENRSGCETAQRIESDDASAPNSLKG